MQSQPQKNDANEQSEEDVTLAQKAPGSPFMFVAFSYPVLLSTAVVALAIYFWLR